MTVAAQQVRGEADHLPNAARIRLFKSILFPPGLDRPSPSDIAQPPCFVDLNLDQVVAAITDKKDKDSLRPIFYAAERNEQIVRYRQEVFRDLDHEDNIEIFSRFRESMARVRAGLDYAGKISYRRHRHMVMLHAIGLYCDAITTLTDDLRTHKIQSTGLGDLTAYLTDYADAANFAALARETHELGADLSRIVYGMLFRGDSVTVRRHTSEPDYATTILERFAKFQDADSAPPPPARSPDGVSLNHIEEGILEFVAKLFPVPFGKLEDYIARYADFMDKTVERFDREIAFFVAYLQFIAPLKRAGLPFCDAEVSVTSKETDIRQGFDLALAAKLVREKQPVVRNDFSLTGGERLIVVSGPNQGGKTTFARMFGQLHFLAGLGCPVPGERVRLFLPDHIFTHFEREEEIANLRGKLEDELVRLRRSCDLMTSQSIVVLNEIFNSTSLDDQVFLSTKILERILAADALGVCVTFIDALSRLDRRIVSMVSTVDRDDPARRTFKIVRQPADGLAYALSLAEKRGVTYARLHTRIKR
jgi:hypothetical protein